MLEQEVDGERQQSTGRLVAGDQEREALGTDVLVWQSQSGLPVDPSDHSAEQVRVVRGITHGSALADQVIHQASHEGFVLFKLTLCADLEPGLDRRLPEPRLRLVEHSDHRLHEWVRRLAIERIEPVSESTQCDRVERQPSHVGRDIDLLARIERIGPYSRARDTRLSIGCARSMARTLPIIGRPLGPGKSSGSRGSLTRLSRLPRPTPYIRFAERHARGPP